MIRNRKIVYEVIICICILLLVANVVSVAWAINNNQSLNVSDIISIIVTLILGISTIVQSQQESENAIQSLQLDVKSHMPYFVIDSIIEDINSFDGYQVVDAQRVDTRFYEHSICSEPKTFVLVGFKNMNRVHIDFLLRNASDILISELNFSIDEDGEWKENVDPILNLIETEVKKSLPDTYEDLTKQHYQELFNNDYANINSNKEYFIHLSLRPEQFKYPISETMQKGRTPETLFFRMKANCLSIYGEQYCQTMEFGLRLYAGLKKIEATTDINKDYNNWVVYEVKKISSKVEIVS